MNNEIPILGGIFKLLYEGKYKDSHNYLTHSYVKLFYILFSIGGKSFTSSFANYFSK